MFFHQFKHYSVFFCDSRPNFKEFFNEKYTRNNIQNSIIKYVDLLSDFDRLFHDPPDIYNDPSQEVDDDFSISFVNKNVSYLINDCCILKGKGQKREELDCDISANNSNTDLIQLVTKFISLKNRFKIFSKQPINTFNYCGTIPEDKASDLYMSSKVNIAVDQFSLYS